MVLGPERLRTINLSVENSTDFKHLSPAEGKKHQSLYSTRPLPHPKTWGNNGELRAWLQGKIQTGCETKAMEGTNRNKAEFNREKGVGNCKRKREKKEKRGRWLETKKVLGGGLLWLALLHQPSPQQECRAAEGSEGCCAPDTKDGSRRDPSPSSILGDNDRPALLTGTAGRRTPLAQMALGAAERSSSCGASQMPPWFRCFSKAERKKQQSRAQCNVVTGSMRTGTSPLSQHISKAHTPRCCQITDRPHPLALSHPFHCTLLNNSNSLSCPAVTQVTWAQCCARLHGHAGHRDPKDKALSLAQLWCRPPSQSVHISLFALSHAEGQTYGCVCFLFPTAM